MQLMRQMNSSAVHFRNIDLCACEWAPQPLFR